MNIAGTTQQYGGLCGVEIVNTGPAAGFVNVLPATTALSIAAGSTLDLGGGSQQVASLSDAAPGSGGSVINSSAGASVLTLSPTGGSTTFSGTIQGGGTLGTIGLALNGSGRQVLAGSNNYTGSTTIYAGVLAAGAVNALSPSSAVTISGGTLDASGFANAVASLSIAGSGCLNLGLGNTLTSGGAAALSGTLNVSGAGTLASYRLLAYASKSGGLRRRHGPRPELRPALQQQRHGTGRPAQGAGRHAHGDCGQSHGHHGRHD